MPKLRIINTVERSFGLIKKDPTLIVLFILPALFPANRIITKYLSEFMFFPMFGNSGLPPMSFTALFFVYLIVGILFAAWASAGAVLKIRELEKGNKLGLREALSKGLRRVPKLLVPTIVALAISVSLSASLAAAFIPYVFPGVSPLVQALAMGFVFVIALYVATRLRLYAPACVLENNFGLKTSWKLVKGNWWRLFAIILIFMAMSAIISLIPIAGVFLADLIVGPLIIAAVTLVYLQLREAKSNGEELRESL